MTQNVLIAASAQQDKAPLTMTTREVADLLEKQHSNIKISAERLAASGVIGTLAVQEFTHNGNTYTEYLLNKRDSLILVAQNSPEFTARIVDRWQELEAKAAQPSASVATLSRLDILKLAMEAEEARIKAEAERDHAVATKAQIGHQREATAMATASVAVRQVESLKTKLDESQQWATIKRMEMAYHGQKFDWRLLKAASTELGLKTKPVFDANYGTVNAYHADAWLEAYAIEIL